MNTAQTASRVLQLIVDAPVWVLLLLKITAILLVAWAVHWALARTNPRWRVFLWRMTAAGLVAVLAAAWFPPALEIYLKHPAPTPLPVGQAGRFRMRTSSQKLGPQE